MRGDRAQRRERAQPRRVRDVPIHRLDGIGHEGRSSAPPGELEYRTRIHREVEGILITDRTAAALLELADSFGVELEAV